MAEAPPTHLDAGLDAVLIGGREPVTVELAAYDPGWSGRYARERAVVERAFGPGARRIEHIGSTAVPGLAAKPIVDILVEVDDPADDAGYRAAMEASGFELRVREPRHRMFRRPARDVHVHVWPAGSAEGAAYLVLRDRLRASPADRRRYEDVKRALAARHWPDMNYYAEAKSAVIEGILGAAPTGCGS